MTHNLLSQFDDVKNKKSCETYRFDSNIKLHQNLVGSDQKNIRFVADQSTLTFDPDHQEGCPEIDLTFLTASRTLNQKPVGVERWNDGREILD